MSRYAEPMANLIEQLMRLPSIGPKTAQRLAFHILEDSQGRTWPGSQKH